MYFAKPGVAAALDDTMRTCDANIFARLVLDPIVDRPYGDVGVNGAYTDTEDVDPSLRGSGRQRNTGSRAHRASHNTCKPVRGPRTSSDSIYAMVASRPSSKLTCGFHPRSSLARVMSGRRRVGSSAGSGRFSILDREPVSATTRSARPRMVSS